MERARKTVRGQRIVDILKKSDPKNPSQKMLVIVLSDGDALFVKEAGSPGADSNWYTYPVVLLNEKEIWRG